MTERRIDQEDVTVVEACTAFVRVMFPRHDILWIEVGAFHEEKGYFPTISIIPEEDPCGDEELKIQIQVWPADGQFINHEGDMMDLTRCEHRAFVLHVKNRMCPLCKATDIIFVTTDPESDTQMRCSVCGMKGLMEKFTK